MAKKIRIDWTNAYFSGIDPKPHRARAPQLSHRLRQEAGEGLLPFLTLPFADELRSRLAELRDHLRRFEHMLVLGIGGSALGARALQKAFFPGQDQPGHDGPWLWIADNVDAYSLDAFLLRLPPEKTLVVAISKSGGTIETISQYVLCKEWLKKQLPDSWKEHLILVTDPEKGFLRQEADSLHLRTLPVPDNLGGRYSVLSAVGMLPAAFMGIDYENILNGAQDMAGDLGSGEFTTQDLEGHPAFSLAVWSAALMRAGYDELIYFSYIPLWATFGDWFAQLWAESLGKEGKGSMPLPSVGVTDQHSVNQMYLDGPRNKACLFLTCTGQPKGPNFPDTLPDKFDFLRGKRFGELLDAEALGTLMALADSGVPLAELRFDADTPFDCGRKILLLELATILTGWLLDINPVDQPAVESGKRLANARLGAHGYDSEKQRLSEFLKGDKDVQEF
jgi:glucose-6-phosphate isomerase